MRRNILNIELYIITEQKLYLLYANLDIIFTRSSCLLKFVYNSLYSKHSK